MGRAGVYDVFRTCRLDYKSSQPAPVQAAMLEWYEGLEEGDKRTVDGMVLKIKSEVQSRRSIPFGAAQGLELLGVIIALQMHWKKVCRG